MTIKINLREKHDKRARYLGFKNRFAMRDAIQKISHSMDEEDYMALSEMEMENLLKEYAKK